MALRPHPTIPRSASPDAVDAGECWPHAFCAFEGCMWEDRFGTEAQLQEHLREKHAHVLEPICERMLRCNAPDVLYSVYCEALAVKCRSLPPIAGSSLDRTALHTFTDAISGDKVEALMCFSCGGVHPYVQEVADKGDIQWYQPMQHSASTGELLFLGQPLDRVKELLGLQPYLSRYNMVDPLQVQLTAHESFEDWCLKLPGLEDDGELLCCPEAGTDNVVC